MEQISNGSSGAQAAGGSRSSSLPSSTFLGCNQKASGSLTLGVANANARVVCEAKAGEGGKGDRWKGLGYDISDDQQDIQRGKGMVDSLFQGAVGLGTQTAVMSSYDYISTAQRTWENHLPHHLFLLEFILPLLFLTNWSHFLGLEMQTTHLVKRFPGIAYTLIDSTINHQVPQQQLFAVFKETCLLDHLNKKAK
jgi:hypothetical protein